jgi:hypothetical protein
VEAFSTFNLASRVLNSDEITLVGDPVFWQGTSKDVNAALNSVLELDFSFFAGVKQQLSTLLQVWNVVVEEKASFDACGMDPTMSRESQEALILAGKIVAARANIAPDEEPYLLPQPQSGSPMSLDEIYARTPDFISANNSEFTTQMQFDGSPIFIKKENLQDGSNREVIASLLHKEKGNQGKNRHQLSISHNSAAPSTPFRPAPKS